MYIFHVGCNSQYVVNVEINFVKINFVICSQYWLLKAKTNNHTTTTKHTNDRRQVSVSYTQVFKPAYLQHRTLIFLYSASIICFILLVVFPTVRLSLITKNSFAVQFGCFIEIVTSCQVIVLFLKLKKFPSSCSMSLPRIRS